MSVVGFGLYPLDSELSQLNINMSDNNADKLVTYGTYRIIRGVVDQKNPIFFCCKYRQGTKEHLLCV